MSRKINKVDRLAFVFLFNFPLIIIRNIYLFTINWILRADGSDFHKFTFFQDWVQVRGQRLQASQPWDLCVSLSHYFSHTVLSYPSFLSSTSNALNGGTPPELHPLDRFCVINGQPKEKPPTVPRSKQKVKADIHAARWDWSFQISDCHEGRSRSQQKQKEWKLFY